AALRAQAVHGELGHGVGEAGVFADVLVIGALKAHPERGDMGGNAFELQEALVEELVGPGAAGESFGTLPGFDFQRVIAFAAGEIEGENRRAPPALLAGLLFLPSGQEVIQCRQEKRREPAGRGSGPLDRSALEQPRQKSLDEARRRLVASAALAA